MICAFAVVVKNLKNAACNSSMKDSMYTLGIYFHSPLNRLARLVNGDTFYIFHNLTVVANHPVT